METHFWRRQSQISSTQTWMRNSLKTLTQQRKMKRNCNKPQTCSNLTLSKCSLPETSRSSSRKLSFVDTQSWHCERPFRSISSKSCPERRTAHWFKRITSRTHTSTRRRRGFVTFISGAGDLPHLWRDLREGQRVCAMHAQPKVVNRPAQLSELQGNSAMSSGRLPIQISRQATSEAEWSHVEVTTKIELTKASPEKHKRGVLKPVHRTT